MVELRKRPQRDPPAPAPARKKGKTRDTETAVTAAPVTESKGESSAAPTGVVGKAKRAASKVKEAVTGAVESSEGGNVESAARQPSVHDEAVPSAVESGEGGMIPETVGMAEGRATVPGESTAAAEGSSAGEATIPSATTAAAAAPEVKKGRGRGKKAEAAAPVTAPAPAPVTAPAPEASTEATTGTADSGTATVLPTSSTTEGKAIRSKAKNQGLAGSSTAATSTSAAATTSTPAAAAPSASAAVTSTTPTEPTDPTTEEARPPATEDLETPPETGKIDTSTTTSAPSTSEPASTPLSPSSVGKQIPSLPSFGGPLDLHTGTKTTFADLLSSSTTGLIIFTYPRASTPGCTTQACSFRDNHDAFTKDSGYAIYGLSTDSVKANTTFVTKQNLTYELICDGKGELVGALGMRKGGKGSGTVRGVVVVDKGGVVRVWFQGGPGKTVDAVKEFLGAAAK